MKYIYHLFLFGLFASPVMLSAQSLFTVSGKVVDEQNSPIHPATIKLVGSGQETATDQQGNFAFSHLEAGQYTLHINALGYTAFDRVLQIQASHDVGQVVLHKTSKEIEQITVHGKYYHNYKMDSISGSLRLQSSLLETPQNIQVLTNDLLADQMATDMRDGVIRNVSGMTMVEHWSDLFARINMRGSRAAAFRNGMNVTSSWGPLTEDMSFVDRIEVVKGPAGFMMSNGEPSGIYNVVTKKPTGQTRGEASLTLGSFDHYRATIDLDGHIDKNEKVLYRFNAMWQTKKSHRDLEFGDRYTIAPVLSYRISDSTTLTFEYTLQHATMSNVGAAYVFGKDNYGTLSRDFSLMERGIEPTNIDDHSAFLTLNHRFNQNWQLTGQLAYFHYDQIGSSLWLTEVEDGVTITDDGDIRRYVSIWDALGQNKYGQLYLNGKFETGSVSHRILGGLDMGSKEYYADFNQMQVLDTGEYVFNIYNPVYGKPQLALPQFDRSSDIRERGRGNYSRQSYTGLYLQDELGFLENRLRLTLAGRLTHVIEESGATLTNKRDQTRFTPRVGISFNIDKASSFYALYDQTFVPQSGLLRNGEQPKPITGNNMEVGLKRDWLSGRLNTTLSAYRILKNNATATDPANSPDQNFVINVGQTTVKGIEFDIKGELYPGLDLVANYAWTDAEITKASEAAVSTIGNKVAGFAAHNANTWITYTAQGGTLRGFGIKAGANYQADRSTWTWTGATGLAPLPNYFRMDGGLFWHAAHISVNLNVNNLLDEYLYSGSAYQDYYYWQTEAGRNFRIGVAYKF